MKALFPTAALLMLFLLPALGQERGLEFLSGIPEFRGLSLKMSEEQLKSQVEKWHLYSKREVQDDRVRYWLVTTEGENVFAGFAAGKCTGIQRMQPIPKQAIKDAIGAAEYEAWMGKRSATNATVAP
jgi:hypothetical protein